MQPGQLVLLDGQMGVLNIEGCYVIATGGECAAGIGGGFFGENNGLDGGIVNIYGGKVKAYGGRYGAGIGGAQNGNGGEVYIYGGNIYAGGGEDAAGIGSGENKSENSINGGTVMIYGGSVFADGRGWGAGIGAGEDAEGDNVKVYGGLVEARAGGCVAVKNGGAFGSMAGENHLGTLTISDAMTVFAGSTPQDIEHEFPGGERVTACYNHPYTRIEVRAAAAKGMTFFDENETTGISKMEDMKSLEPKAEVWYSLNGARLTEKPTTPGIYICNGKKIAIR